MNCYSDICVEFSVASMELLLMTKLVSTNHVPTYPASGEARL